MSIEKTIQSDRAHKIVTGKYIPPSKSKAITSKRKNNALSKGFIHDDVDNPYAEKNASKHPKIDKIKTIRRVSDNPLLLLLTKGLLTQSQFLAGHKYMGAHLICTGQTGQGIDYSRQRVDCSTAPLTLTEKQMHACDIIKFANRELCRKGCNEKSTNEAVLRVQKITGECHTVTQYCLQVRGLTSSKSVSKQLGFLRKDLTVLAQHWGYES